MTMKNLDLEQKEQEKIRAQMQQAIKDDDSEAFAQSMGALMENLQQKVLQEAQALVDGNDAQVLASRGVRQLTSEETKYYQSAIEAMRSGGAQQALSNLDVVLPKTIIDWIFDDLTENHPLLSEIDFQNTGALVEFYTGAIGGIAGWGELCGEIVEELSGELDMVDLTLKKLSAYFPVCNAMLDLGPVWLDRFVRLALYEAIAAGLEAAIVDGDGKDKPLGMTRALTGDSGGVFPRKAPVAINNLDPQTIGGILNTISQTPNGHRRAVPALLMVVGPEDYYTKVFPATTIRATDGTYNSNVLPYPTKIVVSAAMPAGRAALGLAKKYFCGLGTAKGGKLEYTDHRLFLEDHRLYRIKLYGNGRPTDENAFVYADISGIQPTNLKVEVVPTV